MARDQVGEEPEDEPAGEPAVAAFGFWFIALLGTDFLSLSTNCTGSCLPS
ncbi:hypothetical protein HEB29_005797 [Streptomyces fulvorobeus]|uniref:Uncharacterized protein n=1 Tax=Streptomyces fulvorobeus TaxID=284028 RepID=A0A7Y9KWY9_9ACTN|nr:hypothetical protein [Streptomyces fulvorobeus]